MVLDAQTPIEEHSLVEMVIRVGVEELDAQTLKMWARFAAQARILDLMEVTAIAYNGFWWRLMAVYAWTCAADAARAGGHWARVVSWLGSEYREVCREGQAWGDVARRLLVLSDSGVRVAWWLQYATARHERMVALAQQVLSVALTLCTTLGLALPKEFIGTGQAAFVTTTEGE